MSVDLDALIAEVERLRAEKAEMQDALRGVMGAVPVTDVQVAFTGDYGLYVRSVFARLEKERDGWMDSAHMHKHTVADLDTLVTTLRFALSPEGGHEGWRPPRGIDPLVDLALDVREAKEKAEDKAIRFDLDAAGVEARERDAVELVDLRAEVARLTARAEKAEANYAFMVERAANEKLDGYRELGARAAAAENERDELRAENRKLRDVLEWVNTQCPGKCAGVCDAALRGEDAARMVRLRELADEKAHEEERALVVAWLRNEAGLAQEHAPWDGSAHELLVQAAEIIGRGGHIPKKGEP